MNCENCKNKQATVFYADESGGRHALCASCARTLGKISQYDPSEGQKSQSTVFIPRVTLTSLSASELSVPTYLCENENRGRSVCPVCSCTLESAAETGRVGCPECYTVFADALFPQTLTPETALGARMPSSRRSAIDRMRSISELKTQIKHAVESENYELAATLRDKIRKLEGSRNA
jgi:protein arginine kinase activator